MLSTSIRLKTSENSEVTAWTGGCQVQGGLPEDCAGQGQVGKLLLGLARGRREAAPADSLRRGGAAVHWPGRGGQVHCHVTFCRYFGSKDPEQAIQMFQLYKTSLTSALHLAPADHYPDLPSPAARLQTALPGLWKPHKTALLEAQKMRF